MRKSSRLTIALCVLIAGLCLSMPRSASAAGAYYAYFGTYQADLLLDQSTNQVTVANTSTEVDEGHAITGLYYLVSGVGDPTPADTDWKGPNDGWYWSNLLEIAPDLGVGASATYDLTAGIDLQNDRPFAVRFGSSPEIVVVDAVDVPEPAFYQLSGLLALGGLGLLRRRAR